MLIDLAANIMVQHDQLGIYFKCGPILCRLYLLLDLINKIDIFITVDHTSVTYKLKLNGGDIKAVQGDSGHSQVNMVTDVYSHILDEDRKKNAQLFEEAFYKKKNLDPQLHDIQDGKMLSVPDGVDAELLTKVLTNPEMVALLTSLAKTMQKD